MLTALFSGLVLCLTIIVAPGAQNVFLLREGIRHAHEGRRHALTLAAVCFVSDVVLISASVAGFGVIVESVPWLFDVAKWGGVAFLACYGLMAAWRAFRPSGATLTAPAEPAPEPGESLRTGAVATATLTRVVPAVQSALLPAVLTCLAITFLNPHTYVDTVLLLGSVSTHYGEAASMFAVGAITGSAIWFAFITFAARYAARWLRSPRSWQILDGIIAVGMMALAAGIAFA
ncbi:LysE/ArgO family amino acid transporter [Microbacterium amylolyticum]|uniref:L-lysine exporter family protein LysE/ArgO n=1 Tax=Microbacterium amylolyticum TaxID=936337 RepID=A0ABS4ZFZ3_9MICO|nr:LysE family transporter [Microbacterium amylolyticum]MBP2436142.1 L-lysine exporter family protein LysE/ArgO [Microbacterium amylolyticum]